LSHTRENCLLFACLDIIAQLNAFVKTFFEKNQSFFGFFELTKDIRRVIICRTKI